MGQPFFFGAIPIYGVLPYSMIYIHMDAEAQFHSLGWGSLRLAPTKALLAATIIFADTRFVHTVLATATVQGQQLGSDYMP